MRTADVFKLVISNLLRLKFRAILTMLGVVIGTAAVVTLISLAAGAEKQAIEATQKFFGDINQITVQSMDDMGGMAMGSTGAIQEGEKAPKLDEDFVEKVREMNGVGDVLPIRNISSVEFRYKKRQAGAALQAVDPKVFKKFGFKLTQGNFFGGGSKKVVVGAELAKQLFGKNYQLPNKKILAQIMSDSPNQSDSGQKQTKFKIVGVLKAKGGQEDYTVFMAEKKARSLSRIFGLDFKKSYSEIKVKAKSADKAAVLNNKFKKMNLMTMSFQDAMQGMKQMFLILYALLGGVGAIALIVAALGITNTMTMAIYERTKEIGIFKALGTSNRRVMQLFLLEAAAIGFLGGVFGVFGGYLVSQLINVIIAYQQKMKTLSADFLYTPLWLLIFGIVFATLIALLAGIFPAARAARLSPLNALRHE